MKDSVLNAALVMPIVFGGATSVTAMVGVIRLRSTADVNPLLWVGMAVVVVGIVLVARFTPHGGPAHPKSHPAETAADTPEQSPSG